MKTHWILITALAVSFTAWEARAASLFNNISLHVDLLPNTQYEVTAQVSITGVEALVTSLLSSGEDLIQIVDGDGNVLGNIPVQDLVDNLVGLTGDVTQEVTMILNTGGDDATDVVARVLDTPSIELNAVTVLPTLFAPTLANQKPALRVTKKHMTGRRVQLRGTTSDDSQILRVEVKINGKVQHARGTTKWAVRPKLRVGKNRIVIWAIDDAGSLSVPKRLSMVVRD